MPTELRHEPGQPRTLTPADEMRLFAGFVVQPFLAAILAYVSFPWLLLDREGHTLAGGFPADPNAAAISVAFGTAIMALFVTVVFVFPTTVWLVKRRRVSLGQSLLFGAFFANAPMLIGTVLTGGGYGPEGLIRGVAFSSLIGVAGAAAFWRIAIRGRDFGQESA